MNAKDIVGFKCTYLEITFESRAQQRINNKPESQLCHIIKQKLEIPVERIQKWHKYRNENQRPTQTYAYKNIRNIFYMKQKRLSLRGNFHILSTQH